MQIREVRSRTDWADFFRVPDLIYQSDSHFIPHLKQDIQRILNPRNPALKGGGLKVWVLEDGGSVIGRIAAFYSEDKPKAGIGFFECIDDSQASRMLFEAAINFLRTSSKDIVQGPVNAGERDQYWGLMVNGFSSPAYQENYNPSYYQRLFEEAGFKPGIRQTTQEVTPAEFNLSRMKPLADRVFQDKNIELKHFRIKQLKDFAADLVSIYNAAWKAHEHYVPLTLNQVIRLMKSMKSVIREDLIWFTYFQGKPIAFYVSLPDVNQWFRHVNGNFNWWGRLIFILYKKFQPVNRIRGIVFGVIPEFQGRGITSGMMMKIFEVFENDPHLKSTELAWVGDFNPRMLALLQSLGARETKVHVTYERPIDL